MAKYSKRAGEKVEEVMREKKRGTLRSGGSGKKVTSRKQAIAIALSEARREGAKVPKKKGATKKKAAPKKKSATKKKAAPRKKAAGNKRITKTGTTGRTSSRSTATRRSSRKSSRSRSSR